MRKVLATLNALPSFGQSPAAVTKSKRRYVGFRGDSRSPRVDQPVTFGHRIKSSGYAAQCKKVVMFKPQTNNQKPKKSGQRSENRLQNKLCAYATNPEPPFCWLTSERIEAQDTPIFSISYSATGDRLAVAQGNGVCSVYRADTLTRTGDSGKSKSSMTLAGHHGIVSSVEWSLNGRFILTSSTDKSARLWTANGGALRLIVSSPSGGCANGLGHPVHTASVTSAASKVPSEFADHVQFGRFHLQDSLFHVTCRNELFFFTFKVDTNVDILQKCHIVASYKPVTKFDFEECTRLTAVSSTNLFYSYLLAAVGSDRCLYILDINHGAFVRKMPAIHMTTVTGIAINEGSLYSSFGSEVSSDNPVAFCSGAASAYSLFATVAPGDSVRLWDLRVESGHVAELARCHSANTTDQTPSLARGGAVRDSAVPPVSLTFSPCGRYVCFGALYSRSGVDHLVPTVVDIRQTCNPVAYLRPLHRRLNASNPTTVVAWSPIRPEIATGSLDGQLSIFG
uniref:WD_REPEATS_REGION domain-containing protein n=1 Tax=Mesocestoides corti TaxID=53468 RepID=A0A5K3FR00_MESCO